MAESPALLMGITVFTVLFGWFVSELSGQAFIFLDPFVLGITGAAFILAITAGNTPVLRGPAVAIVATTLFGSLFLALASAGLNIVITGIIVVPMAIVFLYIFLEASKS